MKNPFKKFSASFSENKFWKKIKSFGREAGLKTVYTALLLYYAFKRKETPAWARSIILGTLGYFIAPIDALPDLTPILGYTDDVGVLGFGLVTIACYVNEEVKIKARKHLRDWFGNYDLTELAEVDEQL
ncbi:MAG: DUF1232 domain-containing protein [Bacteroidetes bacterium]|nr:MAG: DUF1232 domain-containing protein [Bacteroidota bacterium]